ncbi:MAG: hypothetical protein Q8922_02205 [Bacteroidota bacterium]|nr:hypothetical protein [Bacteroidota bacterium]MDP4232313.1 hypothetical protein [Bacteroidota bacterium]MDP4241452.1 hypothetical protein [Bacteroidota bacterium]MDP4286724.1 hypothetical protein [Bacteroidota bacterium]
MIGRSTTINCVACIALSLAGCQRNPEPLPISFDTAKIGPDTTGLRRTDSMKAASDTAKPALPPMAKAIEPGRLSQYLPKMNGWTLQGELEHELQIRDNFNRSRVAQTYALGAKKVRVEINDFAYIPYLYEPWQKFKGNYLDDDNVARTETTTIAGFPAVQTMEKHDPRASVTLFPGNRYVVSITVDGAEDINDARRIAESMDLKGLESLQ